MLLTISQVRRVSSATIAERHHEAQLINVTVHRLFIEHVEMPPLQRLDIIATDRKSRAPALGLPQLRRLLDLNHKTILRLLVSRGPDPPAIVQSEQLMKCL